MVRITITYRDRVRRLDGVDVGFDLAEFWTVL